MVGGPDEPDELLDHRGFPPCQSGDDDGTSEHAALLWIAETDPPEGLWFYCAENR